MFYFDPSLAKRLTTLEASHTALANRVTALEQKQVTTDQKIAQLQSDNAKLKGDLDAAIQGITNLQTGLADEAAQIATLKTELASADLNPTASAALDAALAAADSNVAEADTLVAKIGPQPPTP